MLLSVGDEVVIHERAVVEDSPNSGTPPQRTRDPSFRLTMLWVLLPSGKSPSVLEQAESVRSMTSVDERSPPGP